EKKDFSSSSRSSQFPVLSSQYWTPQSAPIAGGTTANQNQNCSEKGIENRELLLRLRLRLQFHVSALHLDRVLHRGAAVLLAQFAGFFLDEGREGFEVAGDLLSRLLLGLGERVIEGLDLLPFGQIAGTLDSEGLVHPRSRL